jgi:outer membrane protein TolC
VRLDRRLSLAAAIPTAILALGLGTAAPAAFAQGEVGAVASATSLRAVTFAQAWELAHQRNPRFEAAAAAVLRAQAAAQLARAAWLPALRAQAIYTRLDDERALGDRVLTPRDSINAALVLSAPLVDLPRWRSSGRAKDAVAAARDRSADVERRLAQEVGAGFLGVWLERRALEVIERAAATSGTQLEIARARRAEGLGTRLEEVRAERELRDNKGRAAVGRAALAAAQEALGAVIGMGQPLDVAGPITLPALPALEVALAEVRHRPDLAALARDLALAEAELSDGWVEYLPTLGLTAQSFLQNPATSTLPAKGWQAQLALVVPLFDGAARPALQNDRRGRVLQVRAALSEALLDAESEIRASATALSHRQEALTEVEASARLADESLLLARTAFSEGVGTQVDLIDAERSARDAATAVAVATHDRDRARLDLLLATGRLPFVH